MKVLAALATVALTAAAAQAIGITFIHTGTGSGTLNGVAFGPAQFTITSVGDTANRQALGSGFFIDHGSSQINIVGLGNIDVTTGTRTFVNQTAGGGNGLVGYSRAGTNGSDLYNGPSGGGLNTWDMTTDIGPIAGSGQLLQWTSGAINTNLGVLVFDNQNNINGTFQAIIPAPGAVALLGMSGLLVARRRR